MRILMLQAMDKNVKPYCVYSLPINLEYTIKNDYDYLLYQKNDFQHHPSWLKIEAFREIDLSKYDYVWVLDTDCVVNNHGIRLEDIIAKDPKDIIVSENGSNGGRRINAGSLLYSARAIPELLARYEEWIAGDSEYMQKKYWEQELLNDWLDEDPSRFSVREMSELNSHWDVEGLAGEKANILVYHYMGRGIQDRAMLMRKYFHRRNLHNLIIKGLPGIGDQPY